MVSSLHKSGIKVGIITNGHFTVSVLRTFESSSYTWVISGEDFVML